MRRVRDTCFRGHPDYDLPRSSGVLERDGSCQDEGLGDAASLWEVPALLRGVRGQARPEARNVTSMNNHPINRDTPFWSRKRTKSPENARKFMELQERIKRLRAVPENCSNCGKPKESMEFRTCLKCRLRNRSNAQKMRDQARSVAVQTLETMQQRLSDFAKELAQIRSELSKLRQLVRKMKPDRNLFYFRGRRGGIKIGMKKGILLAKKFRENCEAASIQESLGEISDQELAQINHAYDKDA